LVSYNEKHNKANWQNNHDGANDNDSWNGGVEGPTDDPAIQTLRWQQHAEFHDDLLLSHGVPMLLAVTKSAIVSRAITILIARITS